MTELTNFAVPTMTSVELVKIINDLREDGQAELTHANFLKKVQAVLGEEGAVNFYGSYLSAQNKKLPCYILPKRECHLLVMSESYTVQAAVYDRMVELEGTAPRLPQTYLAALEALIESEREKERLVAENAKLNTLLDNEFGYCSILRASIFLGIHETSFHWRILKNHTKLLGLELKKVPSPRFGYQNLYPLRAFRECYPQYDFDDLTPELVENKALLAI